MGKELQYFVSEAELRLVYNFKKQDYFNPVKPKPWGDWCIYWIFWQFKKINKIYYQFAY